MSNWVVQKPFAIIFSLTDNLTTSTLTAARIYGNGADTRLNIENLPNLSLITTHAADFAVSDPAAAATAICHRAEGQQPVHGSGHLREASGEFVRSGSQAWASHRA